MTRDISLPNELASIADSTEALVFVELQFDNGTLYVHNGIGVVNWNSQDWYGVGDFGAISTAEESLDISPYAITLTLSGIDATLLNEALEENYFLRPVRIYIGFLDEAGDLIDTPDEWWSGQMITMDVALGENNAIALKCDSDLAVFDKSNSRRYNDADQQAEHPGDTFFRWIDQVERASIVWGGEGRNNYSGQIGLPGLVEKIGRGILDRLT